MRERIFTDLEREAIKLFINQKKRNRIVNDIFTHFDEKWHAILGDFRLLVILKRLYDAGY